MNIEFANINQQPSSAQHCQAWHTLLICRYLEPTPASKCRVEPRLSWGLLHLHVHSMKVVLHA